MSEIVRSLNGQPEDRKDIGEAFKKLLGDIPVVDYATERKRFQKDALRRLEEARRAESEKR